MKNNKGDFLLNGICRVPLLNFNKFKSISDFSDLEALEPYLELLSSSLNISYNKWKKSPESLSKKDLNRLKMVLYKYTARVTTRCTPYSIYSSVQPIHFSEKINDDLSEYTVSKIDFSTRLNTTIYFNICEKLKTEIELVKRLKYTCNDTLYRISSEYRYYERIITKTQIKYKLSSVEFSSILERIISKTENGFFEITEIITACADFNYSNEDLMDFILEIVDANILISNIELDLVQSDYLSHLMLQLEYIKDDCSDVLPYLDILTEIKKIY